MNIGIFFAGFEPLHDTKDPGLIARGLQKLGHSVTIITIEKPELENFSSDISIVKVQKEYLTTAWGRLEPEVLVLYHTLGMEYLNELEWVRTNLKCTLIIKADSDGYLSPRPFLGPLLKKELLAKRSMANTLKILSKAAIPSLEWGLLRSVQVADRIIMESNLSRNNVRKILLAHKCDNLSDKIVTIPNPVSPLFSMQSLPVIRSNQIVSVGRWEDVSKNASMLIRVLREGLSNFSHYRAVIVGSGHEHLKTLVSKLPVDIRRRIDITGPLSLRELGGVYSASKVFLSTSLWESFGLAAAESLNCGCTVVGPNLAPFIDFVEDGSWGTVGRNNFLGLTQALMHELELWDNGRRNPLDVASYWRNELNITEIAGRIAQLNKCQREVDNY